ncbi:DUF1294 domain-containing protein [Acidovorax cavernicola]|uniref:DUF1294 domain-containing protein n=1 Tax=Acidovorax cavernicola TaxID=1675792 RepID=A0A9X8D8I7_9BURK|nr:cold shock and DUF1294 domain-containing protein [Acidovorax cavernicola]RIX84741.1 DUF1294 domain-containing protein [Acidovorax cavernicola]
MKRQGTLVRWEKDRGFGFIRSPEVSADVFVHLRDFADRSAAPQVGMKLSFEEIHVGGKGPRAMAVVAAASANAAPRASPRAQPRRPSGRSTAGTPWGAWLIVIYAAGLGAAVWLGRLPLYVPAVVAGLSLLTFVAYALDKSAAQAGRWRTQESTLHLLALVGGWPGAWCAQRLLRHKSSKASFLGRFYATVALHCAALLAWVFWLSKHAAFA